MHPSLAGYSPLLAEAASNLPAQYDFVSDSLSASEREVMDWADSRLFSNDSFLDSRWGPDNWPADVWTASVQAIPLLMLEIDIEKKANGKHVIDWGVDSLDRVLDGLEIYEGVCTSCYGKEDYGTREEVQTNYQPIVFNPGHIHREMLKTFAYFARADGEGILIRSFMENDANDFALLYQRDLSPASFGERTFNRSRTLTAFAWRNLSFINQITLPDGTVESFPTTVYKVIGNAPTQREAAERWFGHINRALVHFTGGAEDFANIYRPYSQTPYTPEPGYLLVAGEAGSPSSTGLTVSAFRLLGLKAEQFFSLEKAGGRVPLRSTGSGGTTMGTGRSPVISWIPVYSFKHWMRWRSIFQMLAASNRIRGQGYAAMLEGEYDPPQYVLGKGHTCLTCPPKVDPGSMLGFLKMICSPKPIPAEMLFSGDVGVAPFPVPNLVRDLWVNPFFGPMRQIPWG